jgi:stalled ribosome alternative rescue factor ArfA
VTTVLDNCGTYAGYQAHRKAGEDACAECRKASAAYMRENRRTWRQTYRANAARQNARVRALRRLAQLYPDVLEALLQDELRRMRRPS